MENIVLFENEMGRYFGGVRSKFYFYYGKIGLGICYGYGVGFFDFSVFGWWIVWSRGVYCFEILNFRII